MPHEFHYRRRIYWFDTDVAGIIHYTSYFRYMEEAETEFMHSLGVDPLKATRADGIGVPRVHASCDFLRPVTAGDMLDIELRVFLKGRASLGYSFTFRHEGEVVARGKLIGVCVKEGPDGKMESVPLPPRLAGALELAPEETHEQAREDR